MNFTLMQPLEQFEIIFLGTFAGIPINNSLIYLIIVYLVIRFFFWFSFSKFKISTL